MWRMTVPADAITRRESLLLTSRDATIVDKLMHGDSLEQWALHDLAPNVDMSKTAVLRAAFHLGLDRIVDHAQDEEYRWLAADTTDDERIEDRAIVASRRARAAAQERQ